MPAELQVFDAIAARLCPGCSGTRLHGALAGALCTGPGAQAAAAGVAQALGIAAEGVVSEALRAALAQVEARLGDPDLGFTPLLPDDDAPLAERVRRLAEWCEAFVDGFSIQGSTGRAMSADASELLLDISAIAGELEPESLAHGAEEDERDYAEIVEFLRVAALNLFSERASRGASGPH